MTTLGVLFHSFGASQYFVNYCVDFSSMYIYTSSPYRPDAHRYNRLKI